jgi:hypothetical protein
MNFTRKFLLIIPVLIAALIGPMVFSAESGWISLIDGDSGIDNFDRVGTANWTPVDGFIGATSSDNGPGYLVTKESYDDFELRVEFWASDDANSGIYMRCQDATTITDRSCYEANIFDQRGDLSFGTGGIVHIAPVSEPYPKVGGKWNTYEITLRGSSLSVILNGETTAEAEDTQFSSGPIALQWGRGELRFRSMQIRPL